MRAVARTLGVSPTPPPLQDIRGTGLRLDVFAKTSDFAIFPRKSRRPLDMASGTNDEARAWEWFYDQVLTGVQEPQRFHQESVARIGLIFTRPSHEIGGCHLPFSVGPTEAAQPLEMWEPPFKCD